MFDYAVIALGLAVAVALSVFVIDATRQINLRTDP
jgi:hypothetical protein